MPGFIRLPQFGAGAVHGLDGHAHAVRKNAMADMAYRDEQVARFAEIVAGELEGMLSEWSRRGTGNVHLDTSTAFGRAAFHWAGLPIGPAESDRRSRQMVRLLDTFGRVSTNPIAMAARIRLDRWTTRLIRSVRSGARRAEPGSVLAAMAGLHGVDGRPVDDRTAAVELQNLTRPTVAVGRFAAFAAGRPDVPVDADAHPSRHRRPGHVGARHRGDDLNPSRSGAREGAGDPTQGADTWGRFRAGRPATGRGPRTPSATGYRAWCRCCAGTP